MPTIDTTKYSVIWESLLNISKPILVTGETGVGKSVITSNLLMKLKEKSTNPVKTKIYIYIYIYGHIY